VLRAPGFDQICTKATIVVLDLVNTTFASISGILDIIREWESDLEQANPERMNKFVPPRKWK